MHRIDGETPTAGAEERLQYQSRRRHTFSTSESVDVVPSNRSYALLKDSPQVERKLRSATYATYSKAVSLDFVDGESKREDKALMTGWLHKTSRLKTSKTRGHRQRRNFKLTTHSLEYSNLLQRVRLCYNLSVVLHLT